MALSLARDKAWLCPFLRKPTDLVLRLAIHNNQCLEARKYDQWSQGWYCRLCEKWADDAHAASADHVSRLDELTATTEMFGECLSFRRYRKPNVGLPTLCDKKSFTQFWGSRIQELPGVLINRLKNGTEIAVRWGGPKASRSG